MRPTVVVFASMLLVALPGAVAAQDASCVGSHTPAGMAFHGSGGTITEPFAVTEGALFADVMMSEAGSLKLMNAAGDSVLLGNAAEPFTTREAVKVYDAGDYYLVADFYGADGDWTLTIEQPSA